MLGGNKMKELAVLIYLLIYMYSGGIDTSDPVLLQNVISNIQTKGMETTLASLEKDLPGILAASGIELPDIKSGQSELPVIDPKKLDYKKELTNLGFYKNESKDAALNLRNAVLRFQSSCNMTVDGKWNDKCQKALAVMLASKGGIYEDVIASPPSEGKWIAVNKNKRILTLYEKDKVIKKYPVAIGNPPSTTPNGQFKVVSKVINPSWGGGGYAKPVKGGVPENPLGYRWIGLSYKDGKTLGIHGNNAPYSIGGNVSHGCIRMINTDVEELFEIVPGSAVVWIGTDDTFNELGLRQKEPGL